MDPSIFILVAGLAFNVALLAWIARDSKARDLDNNVLWLVLVMFTGLIGLTIYIFSRPRGTLLRCSSCNNKRIRTSEKCPHCGNT
ncbi:MAG: PLDc N-terminal domain-containing protein [Blastocatellia bacterium]|nr:PLDc N-terminal domain-containing protein [Blastocatellia bacterium]